MADTFESLENCPDALLLFFHHVPYSHRLRSGKTVIQHIYDTHFEGLDEAERFRRLWRAMGANIDFRRHAEVLERFDRQVEHATAWRDKLVSYWFTQGRVLDKRCSWVQARFSQTSMALLDGWPNLIELTAGNASPDAQQVTVGLTTPDSWSSGPVTTRLGPRELGTVSVPARPAVGPPRTATLRTAVSAGGMPALSDAAEVITAPAGQHCLLALDAGTASSPVFTS